MGGWDMFLMCGGGGWLGDGELPEDREEQALVYI